MYYITYRDDTNETGYSTYSTKSLTKAQKKYDTLVSSGIAVISFYLQRGTWMSSDMRDR